MALKVSGRTAIIVIVLVIAFMAFAEFSSRNEVVPPESWGRVGCTGAVKKQLAAPTTAKIEWGGYGPNPNKSQDYEFAIQGKVTSQNVFGAMLTKDFTCYHNGQQDFRAQVVIAP